MKTFLPTSALWACLRYIIIIAGLFAQSVQATPEIVVYTGSAVIGNERINDAGVYNFTPTALSRTSVSQTFTVENVGTTALFLNSISLAGLDSSQFTIVTSGFSLTLEPGNVTTFTIAFSPTEMRLRQARVEISSNDADESSFLIHLAGQGRSIQPRPVLAWDDQGRRNFRQNDVKDAVDIVAGSVHSLILRSNGTLIAEGIELPQNLTGIVAISAGARHDLAVKANGTVVAWGINTRDHYSSFVTNQSIVPAGLGGVVAVAGGYSHSLALKNDGTVVAWGDVYEGQCSVPIGLNDVIALAAGGAHSLALKRDGTVVAWGGNVSKTGRVPAGLNDVIAIAAGYMHSLALKRNGTVYLWGANASGPIDVIPGLTNVAAMSANLTGNLFLKSDGTVVGRNNGVLYPILSRLSNAIAVAAESFSFALGDFPDMHVQPVIMPGFEPPLSIPFEMGPRRASQPPDTQAFKISNKGTASLNISSVTLSGADAEDFVLDVSGLPSTLAPGASATFSLAVTKIGDKNATVTIVSNDADGSSFLIPVTATGTSYVTIYRGTSTHTFPWKNNEGVHNFPPTAILTSSTAQTFTIRNAGASNLTISNVTLEGEHAEDFRIGGLSNRILQPGASATFTTSFIPIQSELRQARILVTSDDSDEPSFYIPVTGRGIGRPITTRQILAWGQNNFGQITLPAGQNEAVAIAVGDNHNLALKSDGSVVAWGKSDFGQCTVPAGLKDVISVAAGGDHSMVLMPNGKVEVWGRNDFGQSTVPVGLSGVVGISAGKAHSLALKSDGTVVAWGKNDFGQGTSPRWLVNVVAVAAGASHNLALKSDGTVYAWGSNDLKQISVPDGLVDAIGISAGDCSLVLRADNKVLAWGLNYDHLKFFGNYKAINSGPNNYLLVSERGVVSTARNYNHTRNSVPAGLVDAVAVSAGENHDVALGRLVKPLAQSITFNPPTTFYIGQTLKLKAWASSGLPVSFVNLNSPYNNLGDELTANSLATFKIAAVQSGEGAFQAAPMVIRTIIFKNLPSPAVKNSLVLTLVNLTQTYDGTPKSVSVLGAGNVVPVTTYNGSLQAPIDSGKYAVKSSVTISGKIVSVGGTLTIQKAPLFVRAMDQCRLVSQANPALNFTYEGFRGGETESVIQKTPEISTIAKKESPAGIYSITTKGGAALNYLFIHVPGTLLVDGFGFSHEALLSDTNSRSAGKLEVSINAACTSFTAKLTHAEDASVLRFVGLVSVDPSTGLASGTKAMTITKSGVNLLHSLQFTASLDGIFNATYTLSQSNQPDWILRTLPGHGRELLSKPSKPLPYAGSHTFLMEPAQSDPLLTSTQSLRPLGSGWAVATVSTTGILNLTGVLGDGTSITAALNPDNATEPGYRLFIQTSKPVRTGTFVGGAFALAPHPGILGRRYAQEALLHWAKSGEPKDPSFPHGFDNLDIAAMLDPWVLPTKDRILSSRLGLASTGQLIVENGSTGDWNAALPTSITLSSANKLIVSDMQSNPHKWQSAINVITGQISGSFELPDGVNKKRIVKLTGILRQPETSNDPLIGGGLFLLPPAPGTDNSQKPTTVDMTFMRP